MSQAAAVPETGRENASLGRWEDAYAAYSQADESALTPTDLELYAEAAFWTCRADQATTLRQRAHGAYLAAGDRYGAARLALTVSWDHGSRGAFSISQGWLAKAERILAELPESSEHAQLCLVRGMSSLEAGNTEAAQQDLDRAFELAQRLGVPEVQAVALGARGRILVHTGKVDQGLAMLDEASTSALSGELRPFAAGLVYCITISSCQDVGDYRRAAEWTEAAAQWCEQLDLSGFPGACRIHRAQLLRLRGNWSAAEQQALAACQELREFDRYITADGRYEIGEIRRRRGEFAAALEAYREADEIGRDPQPGKALLRLAEGRVDAALTCVRRALSSAEEPLHRLRLLPAQVEIELAAGDLGAARAAAAELSSIVTAYKIANRLAPAFDAQVHLANGQIQLAEGNWPAAAQSLRRAREEWQQVGAPYETAQARMLLGIAYRRAGDEDGAMGELSAALAVFTRLGARLDEERVKELLGRLETRRTFLFTDIVGSTALLETLGDDKWRKLLSRHDQLLRERIVDAGGEVIKQTGDGFFASFDRPSLAVQAAVGIQRALDGEVVAPDVRIGIHTGGAFHPDGDAADYAGQGVHMAARIGAAAAAGEILASRETVAQLDALHLSEPREIELRGFTEPVSVVSVDWR